MTRPSSKSLILDLLSTLRRGAMPVRALVAAGELFDITPNSLRVSLARLCSTGVALAAVLSVFGAVKACRRSLVPSTVRTC
ncbi:MAG: hypothetical protein ABGW95_00195, partial [Candidatus Poseidoniia archaeon]